MSACLGHLKTLGRVANCFHGRLDYARCFDIRRHKIVRAVARCMELTVTLMSGQMIDTGDHFLKGKVFQQCFLDKF